MSAPRIQAEELAPGLWRWRLEAYVEQAAFSLDADTLGLALGDGRLAALDLHHGRASLFQAHEGSCLGLAAHPAGGFVTGGDDGLLAYVSPAGEVNEVVRSPGAWLEHMTQSLDGQFVAVARGREALVLDLAAGSMAAYGPHRAGISGLAFSPAGGVLAATHAGGASLWDLDQEREPTPLDLPGLSLAPAFSPDARYLALGHQENQMHIIDLENRTVFALGGLPAKPGRLAWSLDGGHLLHSGTKAVLCWPVPGCFGESPTPVAFAVQEEARMTALAANRRIPFAACGFSDGRLLLAELKRFAAFIEDAGLGSPVSALAWSPQGMHLGAGYEDGTVLLLDLGAMLRSG